MYFVSNTLLRHALQIFRDNDFADPQRGDWFFETFGPGNIVQTADRPYERLSDYEQLLSVLRREDIQKYDQIHKGTPFFFISWAAHDLRNFEKALFYLDAAISEDVRKDPDNWLGAPGGRLLLLEAQDHVAERYVLSLRESLEKQIERWNQAPGPAKMDVSDVTNHFVRALVKNKRNRTIVTAFYSFLAEFQDRAVELNLRSTEGGSIEPFISHLFKGGLIFESVLKHLYPKKDNGRPYGTLGDIFKTTAFKTDFVSNVRQSSNTLQSILSTANGTTLEAALSTTAMIRNATGHNLVWDDVFIAANSYQRLFEQEVNALFHIIAKRFQGKG